MDRVGFAMRTTGSRSEPYTFRPFSPSPGRRNLDYIRHLRSGQKVDDDAPITGDIITSRRAKYVSSRPVAEGQIEIFDPRPQQPPPPHSPIFDELQDPEAPPAVDPTQLGLPRPRRHRIRYRLAQLSITAALAATAVAVIGVALADRKFANIVSIIAVVAALLGLSLSMRSRMAARIMGYAIAACALSALTAAIVLTLPRHWFEDRHPEELPPAADVRPRVQN